ncbi:AraC family transcriptional activator FtrA [Roseibium hamelinense]|uniref:AraC family transcriptional activator FtrA n=1 Tax=Roseibium hamelinense TaxID=150831 RepID=A0A562TB40_9HYPH|nr:transcriptional regulator FtrA [Roseibium hamelinense]MTI45137.1 transcriptional regulator FtrA [Roseibium hamelinense]TWI90504.1 AraC family transcriptional activator FtrA [Roseibium hamelinense]
MPNHRSPPPLPPNLEVVALAYDGLCLFEFGIAYEVFGLNRPEMGENWYSYSIAAVEPGVISTAVGLSMKIENGVEALENAGTVIVPGWAGLDVPVPDAVKAALIKAHSRGARILSICSSVVVLAETGLLDGQEATTHWRYADTLQARYPRLKVQPNVLYTDNGQILTSAGSAAGIDLCLHLVRRDFGPKAANMVARRLVVPPHRDGGQAQFINAPVPAPHEAGRLSPLFAFLRENLDQTFTLETLAQRAGMSRRTFLRRFEEATGTTPARWLTLERLKRAKELLELADIPVDQVALSCGFGTAMTLRHHFRQHVGTSPSAYRSRFQQVPTA